MFSPFPRGSAFAVLLLATLFSACELERAPLASPTPTPVQPAPLAKPSRAAGSIIVHYHRTDADYDAANLYTWDGNDKHQPSPHERRPVGIDDFGAIFQLDRSDYGNSDRIGLITRLGTDWSRKDGGDKFWTPELGDEVWVISGHDKVWQERPAPLPPRDRPDNREFPFNADAVLGATYSTESTTFRLFAPTAGAVRVILHDEATGGAGRTETPMTPADNGIWEGTIPGDLQGKFYTYALTGPGLDSEREVVDPYATNTVASSTRARITSMTRSTSEGPPVASPTDMVIYEMQMRDFTIDPSSGVKNRGLYLGFAESGTRLPTDPHIKTALDHLSELGVTHVQLMPVQDFENDESKRAYNWGYITQNYFSPEGMFATDERNDSRIRELKALIAALHGRGIGVLLDVVYNHTSENAPFSRIVPGYYYRHLADGSLANGSGCGNEFRSEAPMARKLMIDSLAFWVREYGVDGFRFDLMALHDRETMREAENTLRAIDPDIVLYGEPWMASTTPLEEKTDKTALSEVPVGAFNDDFRNALKGAPDGSESGSIQDGSQTEALKSAMRVSDWFPEPTQSINYMTCHDNLVLWDKLKLSMPGASEDLLKRTMKLGYLALITSQGVPFVHGGEEFARSKVATTIPTTHRIRSIEWTGRSSGPIEISSSTSGT